MNETMIRPETPQDVDAVRAINVAAFLTIRSASRQST